MGLSVAGVGSCSAAPTAEWISDGVMERADAPGAVDCGRTGDSTVVEHGLLLAEGGDASLFDTPAVPVA
ncbi:hypothetical protein [Streptomyces sp. LN499]|uniref:hypothetical protein n=1 Tax=Streptomyces sp. LN499 TaxID=3112977 RepID=UPI003721B340